MSSMSPCYITVMVPESLHGRPLPPELVALASTAGQAWFAEALAAGTMASYFAVAEQVQTQADPAYCGLTSMAVALNSLGIDPGPGRTWKGPWRWFSEELVACCLSLERVRAEGVTLDQVAMLGRCNGAVIDLKHADAFTVDELRTDVLAVARGERDARLLAAYGRGALGQTGDGHMSPLGGYHAGRDAVLVLDVARFKYPAHWVPLPALHQAMTTPDVITGRARGWLVVGRAPSPD